jgi:hypothetical protein
MVFLNETITIIDKEDKQLTLHLFLDQSYQPMNELDIRHLHSCMSLLDLFDLNKSYE